MRMQVVAIMVQLVMIAALLKITFELRASIQHVKEVDDAKMRLLVRLEATLQRMEGETVDVAHGREKIAGNLASSVGRADATKGQPGEAADAALRTGDTAAAITKRQDEAGDDPRQGIPTKSEWRG